MNRTTNANNREITPYEIYFGKRPKISHLRTFGCLAFVKIQEKKRSGYQKKLEPRSYPTMMVGYERDFTYRLYDSESKTIILSRDVIFDETKPGHSVDIVNSGSYDNFDNYLNSLVGVSSDQEDDEEISDESPDDRVEVLAAMLSIPNSYKEAVNCPQSEIWVQAMKAEMASLKENNTYDLVELPEGRKANTV